MFAIRNNFNLFIFFNAIKVKIVFINPVKRTSTKASFASLNLPSSSKYIPYLKRISPYFSLLLYLLRSTAYFKAFYLTEKSIT